MSAIVEYKNNTILFSHVNETLSLVSLMSAHFLVNSFMLVSDLPPNSVIMFQKMASKYFIEISHRSSVQANNLKVNDATGYIIIDKYESDISKALNTKAKLILVIYNGKKNNLAPLDFLSKLVFPPSISFFVVLLLEEPKLLLLANNIFQDVTAECFTLYKPISTFPLKIFPTIFYGGQKKPQWVWINKEMDWNFFKKETRNMNGTTITIALASYRDKRTSIKRFWKSKNSFFWRSVADYLRFRSIILFRSISSQSVKSRSSIYLSLLKTTADGLGVLPVISPERDIHLEFIVTGLDSKYHLMVKAPEYVYSWKSIFKPLAPESWLCMGMAILLFSLTLRIITYQQNLRTLTFFSCFLMVFGFVCFQGCPRIPRCWSARLVCYTTLLFSILMYQFYTSNFYSLLSTKEVKLPFTSLEQFMGKRTYSLYIHPDTALYEYIAKAKSGSYKKLWEEFLSKDPSHKLVAATLVKSFNKVCKGNGAVLGLPFQTIYLPELRCKLVPVNSGFFPKNIVTVVRKNFPFKAQFKFVHLRLLEAGLSHKFRDEFLNIEGQHKTKTRVVNEVVSLEHVAFLFITLTAFAFVSLLVLIFEILIAKTIRSKK